MLNVIVVDNSHRDRPSLSLQASGVISSPGGTMILGAKNPSSTFGATSISNLMRDIRQGFDFTLSHDWVVKVYA